MDGVSLDTDAQALLYQQLDRAIALVASLHRALAIHTGALTPRGVAHTGSAEAAERSGEYWRTIEERKGGH